MQSTILTGKTINYWKVGKLLEKRSNTNKRVYECACACGTIKNIEGPSLTANLSKSCGCQKVAMLRKHNFRGVGELNLALWSTIKHNAKIRDMELYITIQEAWNLYQKQNGRCAISGVEIKFMSGNRTGDQTASLDRIDSTKGYITGNLQWVHKLVNRMKMELAEDIFLDWIKKIYKHKINP